MNDKKKKIVNISEGKHFPKEEMLEISRKRSNLIIGIPKEISFQENRIALVPEAVGMLVKNGHRVLIENNAGNAAHFSDNEYSEHGAQIVYNPEEVYTADVILKVAPLSMKEIEMVKPRQTVFSALHLTGQKTSFFRKLMQKKITAISFEHIKDRTNSFPIMRSLSELAGNTAVLLGAKYLALKGEMFGGFTGIPPSELVILGAGTVGEYAARTAIGLGASVKVFDDNIYKLRSLQHKLNTQLYTSIIQPKILTKALEKADVAIGAMHVLNGLSPCLVSEEMVKRMKSGSVIIDVCIDKGGCFETSRVTNYDKPIYKKHDVIHYCIPNITSRVSHTASHALSNYFGPVMLRIGEEGGVVNLLKADKCIRNGAYLFTGIITNDYISNNFNLPYQDIELLMATCHG